LSECLTSIAELVNRQECNEVRWRLGRKQVLWSTFEPEVFRK